MKIKHAYLTFAVNHDAAPTTVYFEQDGQAVMDLQIRLGEPSDFTAYIDVSRFIDRELTVSHPCGVADAIPEDEQRRPTCHFTVKNGWNNDPNGLIFADGVYHLYYQHNPCGRVWGNMHWGHATSTDLLHWQEQGIVLFPDAQGRIYSGCAVRKDADIFFYYTCCPADSMLAKGGKTVQRLAVSQDGGRTLTDRGVVLDQVVPGNRDPQVVWVEECGKYIMVLFLDGNRFAFYGSPDLSHWTPIQELTLSGARECPNLVKVGDKWVFFDANGYYTVGHFEDDRYVPEQALQRMFIKSKTYAGQVFFGTGEPTVIDWLTDAFDAPRFSQGMTLPYRLGLYQDHGRWYLTRTPIEQWQQRLCRCEMVGDGAYELRATVQAGDSLALLGDRLTVSDDSICYGEYGAPLFERGEIDLRVLIDNGVIEVLADHGRSYFAAVGKGTDVDAHFERYQVKEDE